MKSIKVCSTFEWLQIKRWEISYNMQWNVTSLGYAVCVIFKMWETKPGYAGWCYTHRRLHKMNYKKNCITVDQWDLRKRSCVRHGNSEMKWWMSREKRQTVGSVWCGCCWFYPSIYSMMRPNVQMPRRKIRPCFSVLFGMGIGVTKHRKFTNRSKREWWADSG